MTPPPPPAPRQSQGAGPVPLLLIGVLGGELLARVSGSPLVQEAAWWAMLAVLLMSWRGLGLREYYLISACAGLTGLVLAFMPDPAPVLRAAREQAVFLMAFILLLGMLQSVARTSPSIATVGAYLTRQPAGRRYLAIHSGTALLAVLFNVGVNSFLVPLIQRGIRESTPGDPLNDIRERRQISALLRGFAWSVVCSPTAFAPLIVASLIPGVQRGAWIGYGLGVFVLFLGLGWAEDRLRFARYRPQGPRLAMAFPRRAAALFAATTAWLMLLVLGFAWALGETVILGLLLACPVMTLGWLMVQAGWPAPGAWPEVRPRLARLVARDLPGSVNVALTLAASGYIGRAAGSIVPAAALAEALGLALMPDWVLLALIPPFLCLVSLLALSPTMMAVFMGSFFAQLPVLPADPTHIAFAVSCGWALSMTFSPFATVVLVISRASGIAPGRLTWGWNLGFTVMAALALVPVFALLTGGA